MEYKIIKTKKGFSLVEVLIAMGIMTMISLLVASVYFAHAKLFSNQNTQIDVASQNKVSLDEFTQQIREAQSIVTTCPSCGGDTTGAEVIILQLWPVNAAGEAFDPMATNYDYVVYRLDPADTTKLIKKTYPTATSTRLAGTKVISSRISGLLFEYNDANIANATEVTITLSNASQSINRNQSFSQSTKVTLRNK